MNIAKKKLPDILGSRSLQAMRNRLQTIKKNYETAQFLADLFISLGRPDLAKRIANCYRRLRLEIFPPNPVSIISFEHCEIRVCPFCSYRWASQLAKKYEPLIDRKARQGQMLQFITLTVADILILDRAVLDEIWACWVNLRRQKLFKEVVATLACLEIKRNEINWHPHLHLILIGGKKISEDALSISWYKLTGNSYIVKNRPAGFSIFNLITYSLKITEIQNAEDLRQLYSSIDNYRLLRGTGKLWGIKASVSRVPAESFNNGPMNSFNIDATDLDEIIHNLDVLLGGI